MPKNWFPAEVWLAVCLAMPQKMKKASVESE